MFNPSPLLYVVTLRARAFAALLTGTVFFACTPAPQQASPETLSSNKAAFRSSTQQSVVVPAVAAPPVVKSPTSPEQRVVNFARELLLRVRTGDLDYIRSSVRFPLEHRKLAREGQGNPRYKNFRYRDVRKFIAANPLQQISGIDASMGDFDRMPAPRVVRHANGRWRLVAEHGQFEVIFEIENRGDGNYRLLRIGPVR